jgi:ABC-type protease/lipase transport system fused ATPase/permease subunit
MRDGAIEAFGSRDEVMARMRNLRQAPAPQSAPAAEQAAVLRARMAAGGGGAGAA